jgi:hypothetical protein
MSQDLVSTFVIGAFTLGSTLAILYLIARGRP